MNFIFWLPLFHRLLCYLVVSAQNLTCSELTQAFDSQTPANISLGPLECQISQVIFNLSATYSIQGTLGQTFIELRNSGFEISQNSNLTFSGISFVFTIGSEINSIFVIFNGTGGLAFQGCSFEIYSEADGSAADITLLSLQNSQSSLQILNVTVLSLSPPFAIPFILISTSKSSFVSLSSVSVSNFTSSANSSFFYFDIIACLRITNVSISSLIYSANLPSGLIFIGDCALLAQNLSISDISMSSGIILNQQTTDKSFNSSIQNLSFTNCSIPSYSTDANSLQSAVLYRLWITMNSLTFSIIGLYIANNNVSGFLLYHECQSQADNSIVIADSIFSENQFTLNALYFKNIWSLDLYNIFFNKTMLDSGEGQSILSLKDVLLMNIVNFSASNAYTTHLAPAISLVMTSLSLVGSVAHRIQDSVFRYNKGNFTSGDSQSTVYLDYGSVPALLWIRNASFESNVFVSSLMETEASSALYMRGTGLNVTMEYCNFVNNTSSDISSAIFFALYYIQASQNYFFGNTYSDESNFYGALFIGAVYLHFSENYFIRNDGVDGACIKVYEDGSSVLNEWTMEKLIIIRNYASYQAAFLSRDAFQAATVVIDTSYFANNSADQYSGCFYFGTLYNTPTIKIYLIKSIFLENFSSLSGGVLYTAFSGEDITIYFNQSMLILNYLLDLESIYPQGGMCDLWGFGASSIYFNNCLSYHNYASNGGFLSMVVGQVFDSGSRHISNNASMLGGNFFLSSNVLAEFSNCSFLNASAKLGGAFFVHHDSSIDLSMSTFTQIYATRGGVFMLDLSSWFHFDSLEIVGISGDLGALIYLTNTDGITSTFENSLIKESTATISLIYCEQANLELWELNFSNISSTIYHFHLSSVEVISNQVAGIMCSQNGEGCIINVFRTDNLTMAHCRFINMTRQNTFDGGFAYSMESKVTFVSLALENIDSQMENSYGPVILGTSSEIIIKNLNVLNFQKGGIWLKESFFIMHDSVFNNTNSSLVLFQSTVYCENCYLLLVKNTTFEGISFSPSTPNSVIEITCSSSFSSPTENFMSTAIRLGVWDFETSSYPDSKTGVYFLQVSSSKFMRNSGYQGTVVYIYDSPYVSINDSYFFGNVASDKGGCIYIYFDSNSFDTAATGVIITKNAFVNNSALNEGGVLKWDSALSPSLSSNYFALNSAKYGPDIASLPVRVAFKVYLKSFSDSSDPDTSELIFDSLKNNTGFEVFNHMSGDTASIFLSLQLVDDLDQPILESNSRAETEFIDGKAYLSALNLSSFSLNASCPVGSSKTIERFNITCNEWLMSRITTYESLRDLSYQSNKTVPVSLDLTLQKNNTDERIYNKAERIVLTNTPSTYGFLLFRSKMVVDSFWTLISKTLPNECFDLISQSYSIIIPVFFRVCLGGENYDNDTNTCQTCVKTRYSFNPFNNGCKLCPPNADCNGGMNISISPGYWRSRRESDLIYRCEVSLASCQGGLDSNCSSGYSGRLCDICEGIPDRNKNAFGLCDECPGPAGSFIIFLVLFMLTFAIISGYTCLILGVSSKNKEEKYAHKALFKVLLNFIQTFGLMPLDNIPLPRFMFYYYKVISMTLFSLDKWVYSGCFHGHFSMVSSRSHNGLIFYIISVFIMALMVILLDYVRYKKAYEDTPKEFRAKIAKALIFLLFYFQPSMLILAFRGLSCRELEGNQYAKFDMNQECWDSSHTAITVSVNMVIILYFYFIFMGKPYIAWFRFVKKRMNEKELKEYKAGLKDHFFFLGYDKKFHYWELVIFLRKIIMITYVSLVDADGNSIAIAILILNISHLLHLYFKPCKSDRLNQYENSAYFVMTLNYYFLLFFYIEETNENMDVALFILSLMGMLFFVFATFQVIYYQKFNEKYKIISKLLRRWFGKRTHERVADGKTEKKVVKKRF